MITLNIAHPTTALAVTSTSSAVTSTGTHHFRLEVDVVDEAKRAAPGPTTCSITETTDCSGSIVAASVGGIARSIASKTSKSRTLYDYGAVCLKGTDDTVAIQAALDDLPNHPVILVPAKCYTSGNLQARQPGTLRGLGQSAYGAGIVNTSATNDTFDVTAQFVHIEDLYLSSSVTKTAGSYIHGTANRLFLDKIFCDTPFNCINADGVNVGYFSNVTAFWYATPQANSTIFTVQGNGGDIRISRAYSIGAGRRGAARGGERDQHWRPRHH